MGQHVTPPRVVGERTRGERCPVTQRDGAASSRPGPLRYARVARLTHQWGLVRLYLEQRGGAPQPANGDTPFLRAHDSYSGGAALGYSGLVSDPAPSYGRPLAGWPAAFPACSGAGRLCLPVTERTADPRLLGRGETWSFVTPRCHPYSHPPSEMSSE